MNKKLMAVAVAGALAAPGMALAQSSTVQIGGSLTAFYYRHSPNNPGEGAVGTTAANAAGSRGDILEPSEPELFVRGEEQLGGGLSAWFQCTSQLDGIIGGAAASLGSGFCNRNSGVGFKGGFGHIFAGNWDTPQKLVYNRGRGWFGSTNSLTGGAGRVLYGNGPSGVQNPSQTTAAFFSTNVPASVATLTTTSSNVPGGFVRRQANSFVYHSPSWGGFSVLGQMSAGNESTGRPEADTLSPRLMSLAGQYSSGPLYVGVAYEKHQDYSPGNIPNGGNTATYSGGDDINWTIVGGFKFGAFDLRALYTKTDYEVHDGGDLKVKGWALWGDWAIGGPHTLRAQFVNSDDTKGTSTANVTPHMGPARIGCGAASTASCAADTGSRLWTLVYSYAFSKRTEGSIAYAKLRNDANAAVSLGKVNATAGQGQTSTGLVLKHRF